MHVRLQTCLTAPSDGVLPWTQRVVCVLLLVVAVAGFSPGVVHGQTGFPGAPNDPALNLRIYPLDTWSPRVGAGIGAGLVFHHLGRHNAQGLLTFAPARREQVATAAWASASPQRARRYVLLSARGLHTNADWFYGLGPSSSPDARQSIERSSAVGQVRVGQAFFDHRLIIQPQFGISHYRIDRIPNPAADRYSTRTRRHLQQLATNSIGTLRRSHTGIQVGMSIRYDSRTPSTTGGFRIVGEWSRHVDLAPASVQFDMFDVGAYGFVPLGSEHHLATQLRITTTEARGQSPVPYYQRPTLGGSLVPGWGRSRFVGSDRLITSLLYRFPLGRLLKIVDIRGHAGIHAASVYNDLGSEVGVDLSFEESLPPNPAAIPLRPAASVGARVKLTFRQTPSLNVALGLSPEGVSAVQFSFTQNLTALRPAHHSAQRAY